MRFAIKVKLAAALLLTAAGQPARADPLLDVFNAEGPLPKADNQQLTESMNALRGPAEAGNSQAQFVLGMAYYRGIGLAHDRAKALDLWRRSGTQGNPNARSMFAIMYMLHAADPQDYPLARSWLELSAKEGNGNSRYFLALMYEDGDGITKDSVKAWMWMKLALSGGDIGSKVPAGPPTLPTRSDAEQKLASIAAKMTQEQLAEADMLAVDWKPECRNHQAPSSQFGVLYCPGETEHWPDEPPGIR